MKVGTLVKYKMEEWMVRPDPGLGIVIDWDGFDHHTVRFFEGQCTYSNCTLDELIEVSRG